MEQIKAIQGLGVISGTSIDGVDIASLTTDGIDIFEYGEFIHYPYDEELKNQIRALVGKVPQDNLLVEAVSLELTKVHAEFIKTFISDYNLNPKVIGYEGHIIYNCPKEHQLYQIGKGDVLSSLVGIKVVGNFHKADMLAGGQGFPLEPIYHMAITSKLEKPLALVDIAGISNITWIGSMGEMLAFDCGPGNAAINDWVYKHANMQMDYNGKLAITGNINEQILVQLMKHKYFAQYPPKSADRNLFNDKLEHLEGLSLEDGAATATAFVAESIAYSLLMYSPELPKILLVSGGGAKNPTILRFLRQRLPQVSVQTINEEGLIIDALEAQSIAFEAVRRLYCLPISFPNTTGVPEPMIGGQIWE